MMAKETKTTEATFSLEALRNGSRDLFGVSQSTFDGATCGMDQTQKYAVEEMKNTIEEWGKRSVE